MSFPLEIPDEEIFYARFALDQSQLQRPVCGEMRPETVNEDIFNTSAAFREILLPEKGCSAISCRIEVEGKMPASGLDVFKEDVPDRRAYAEHPDHAVTILGADIADDEVFNRTTAEIQIFQTHHAVIGIQCNQIVIRLAFGEHADIFHNSVPDTASEMQPVLIERRLFTGDPEIPDEKIIQAGHPEIVDYGIGKLHIFQMKTADMEEIESRSRPCIAAEKIRILGIESAAVVSIPDSAGDPDVFISVFVIGVGQQEIAALFRGFAAEEKTGSRSGVDAGMGTDEQGPGDPIASFGNPEDPFFSVKGFLNGAGIIGRAVAYGSEISDVDLLPVFHFFCPVFPLRGIHDAPSDALI